MIALTPFRRSGGFLALLDLFTLPQDVTYTNGDAAEDLSALDPEESGFQASFARLGASEAKVHDPVKDVKDERLFASNELARRSKERPGAVSHCAKMQRQDHPNGFSCRLWSSGPRPKRQRWSASLWST